MPTFRPEYLHEVTRGIFQAAGVPADESTIIADRLVSANLVGHDSHGVIRIPQYIPILKKGEIKPGQPITILSETSTTAVIDGNWGFGQVVATRATRLALEKARQHGVSAVCVRQQYHVGRLGDYPELAAREGFISMATVNASGAARRVAPFGGKVGRLSTNPMAWAIPRPGHEPIVHDFTTSVVAEGKLRVASNRKKPVPDGWIVDHEGRPTNDPASFYGPPPGALLPLGGVVAHKGFGLSLVVEVLSGAISGAGVSREGVTRAGNGMYIQCVNVEALIPLEEYSQHVETLIAHVKNTPTLPGFDEILIPGEPESREREKRRKEGVYVEDETWMQIRNAAEAVGYVIREASRP